MKRTSCSPNVYLSDITTNGGSKCIHSHKGVFREISSGILLLAKIDSVKIEKQSSAETPVRRNAEPIRFESRAHQSASNDRSIRKCHSRILDTTDAKPRRGTVTSPRLTLAKMVKEKETRQNESVLYNLHRGFLSKINSNSPQRRQRVNEDTANPPWRSKTVESRENDESLDGKPNV